MKAFVKTLKVLGAWLLRYLWLALPMIIVAERIAKSNDPGREAIFQGAFVAAMVAVVVLLELASRFFRARLSERAFRALGRATIGVTIAVGCLAWLLIVSFDSWSEMIAAFRSGDAPRILIARAMPGLQALAPLYVVGAAVWLVETRLRGDVRLAARIVLAALVTFSAVVILPAGLNHQAGQPLFDRGVVLALVLWLGMVLPALGVFIAYRRIGDGRT